MADSRAHHLLATLCHTIAVDFVLRALAKCSFVSFSPNLPLPSFIFVVYLSRSYIHTYIYIYIYIYLYLTREALVRTYWDRDDRASDTDLFVYSRRLVPVPRQKRSDARSFRAIELNKRRNEG